MSRRLALLVLATLAACRTAAAQLPMIRLDRVEPPGARAGSALELTVEGEHFEEVRRLHPGHPGIRAEFVKQDSSAKATFCVSIDKETPPGTYDLRAVGRYGASNPMLFDVSDLPEDVVEKEPNDDVSAANRVPLECAISGSSDGNGEDHFVWSGRRGQRVLIECLGSRLGSRLDGTLLLFNTAGKEVASNRSFFGPEPLIDFLVPADGDYIVRFYDFNYTGGLPYRLRISTRPLLTAVWPPAALPGRATPFTFRGRNLPGETLALDVPVPPEERGLSFLWHPPLAAATLEGFQYRVTTSEGVSNPLWIARARAAPVAESEPNNAPPSAQALSLPCEVHGRLAAPGDEDWFALTLKAGERVALEVTCERQGLHGDPYLLVQNAKGEDLAEFDDSGGQIGQWLNTTNRDPTGILQAPEDGRYLVLVTDRYQRGGERFAYRLYAGPPRPDYHALVAHHPEGPPSALLVRQGGSQCLYLALQRRDGFEGEVGYAAEGLPAGVTAPEGVAGPGVNIVPIVFTASPDAPETEVPIRVRTWATIDGTRVEREARPVVRAVTDQPQARMARDLLLAVRPAAPYALTASPEQATVAPGQTVELRVALKRLSPEFKGGMQVVGQDPPPEFNLTPADVAADQTEGVVRLTLGENARPGSYTLVLRGEAQVPFTKDPKAENKQAVRVTDPAPPVRITVTAPAKKE